MKTAKIVTIDGPVASGKTSVSREVAKNLGWSWVSTGVFYRGLAFMASDTGMNLEDEEGLIKIISSKDWCVKMGDEITHFYYKKIDITEKLPTESIGEIASKISQLPRVRQALLEPQRECAVTPKEGLLAEGRDCGTVVFPKAQVKIFITARKDSRARRRAEEQGGDEEEALKRQQKRDAIDMGRKQAPLRTPENAFVIDTSDLSFLDVVHQVESHIRTSLGMESE